VFGKGAAVGARVALDALAEHLVAGAKPGHVPAHCLDVARHIRSRDPVLRPAQPGSHQAQDVRPAGHHVPDVRMDGSRADPYQYLVIADCRLVDVPEFQGIG